MYQFRESLNEIRNVLILPIHLLTVFRISDHEGISDALICFTNQKTFLEDSIKKVTVIVFHPSITGPASLIELSSVNVLGITLHSIAELFSLFESALEVDIPFFSGKVIVVDDSLSVQKTIRPLSLHQSHHLLLS